MGGTSVILDVRTSANTIPTTTGIKNRQNAPDGCMEESKKLSHESARNFSLFNLLCRSNMEEVFVSLSEMLKYLPKGEGGTGVFTSTDFWCGNVRLSRNMH